MKNEILLISAEIVTFNFDDGTLKDMTKLDYAIKMIDDNEKFVGLTVLQTYLKKDVFDKIKKFICQKVQAEFMLVPTKNGAKYTIKKLNDIVI